MKLTDAKYTSIRKIGFTTKMIPRLSAITVVYMIGKRSMLLHPREDSPRSTLLLFKGMLGTV